MFRSFLKAFPFRWSAGAQLTCGLPPVFCGITSQASSLPSTSQLPSEENVAVELARMGESRAFPCSGIRLISYQYGSTSISEGELRRSSRIDGSKRIQLSSSVLSAHIPQHGIEPGENLNTFNSGNRGGKTDKL